MNEAGRVQFAAVGEVEFARRCSGIGIAVRVVRVGCAALAKTASLAYGSRGLYVLQDGTLEIRDADSGQVTDTTFNVPFGYSSGSADGSIWATNSEAEVVEIAGPDVGRKIALPGGRGTAIASSQGKLVIAHSLGLAVVDVGTGDVVNREGLQDATSLVADEDRVWVATDGGQVVRTSVASTEDVVFEIPEAQYNTTLTIDGSDRVACAMVSDASARCFKLRG